MKLSSSISLQLLGNSRLRVKNEKMRNGAIMGIVVANKAFRTDAHIVAQIAQIAQIAENARVQEDPAIKIIMMMMVIIIITIIIMIILRKCTCTRRPCKR